MVTKSEEQTATKIEGPIEGTNGNKKRGDKWSLKWRGPSRRRLVRKSERRNSNKKRGDKW
jgi:hypothetical protein